MQNHNEQHKLARFFNFPDTPVHISSGPLHSDVEKNRDIPTYLKYLTDNKVKHVFAVGNVFDYYPQDGSDENHPIIIDSNNRIDADFTNYFLPDAEGKVQLPVEMAGYTICSTAVIKVGRIVSYQITINNGEPILVHHYPLRDKQPLNLTAEEFSYIKTIQINSNQGHIVTHCRGGRGRSGQFAAIFLNAYYSYSSLSPGQALERMRLQRTGKPDSKEFIETKLQEEYISSLKDQAIVPYKPVDNYFLAIYGEVERLLREELSKLEAPTILKDGMEALRVNSVDTNAPEYQALQNKLVHYGALTEIYHGLSTKKATRELFAALLEAQNSPIASKAFKASCGKLVNRELLLDFNVKALEQWLDLTPQPTTLGKRVSWGLRSLPKIAGGGLAYFLGAAVEHYLSNDSVPLKIVFAIPALTTAVLYLLIRAMFLPKKSMQAALDWSQKSVIRYSLATLSILTTLASWAAVFYVLLPVLISGLVWLGTAIPGAAGMAFTFASQVLAHGY